MKFEIDGPAIIRFIEGEVRRQGFNLTERKGLLRVGWMIEAWGFALLNQGEEIDREAILYLGEMVEKRNKHGFRRYGVRVGGYVAPSFLDVPVLVQDLLRNFSQVSTKADAFYLEFQRIHPFVDGNGRVGKILHNWILGSLARPVLIRDYFGGGNP